MTLSSPLSACCKAEYIIATKPHLMSNSEPYPMCTTCGLPCDLQPPAESDDNCSKDQNCSCMESSEPSVNSHPSQDGSLAGGSVQTSEIEELLEDIRISADEGDNYGDILRDVGILKPIVLSLESKLRLALDGLEKIAAKHNYDSLIAKDTLTQIQLLTPKA